MTADPYLPFPDVNQDRRSADQQARDRAPVTAQVQDLERTIDPSQYDSLLDALNSRRIRVPSAVQGQLLNTTYDRHTVAAKAEIVVDITGRENGLQETVDLLLAAPQPIIASVTGSTLFDENLLRLVLSPKRQSDSIDDISAEAIRALTEAGIDADYNYVAAFQGEADDSAAGPAPSGVGVGHDVVVKEQNGPTPTVVQYPALYWPEQANAAGNGKLSPAGAVDVAVIDTGLTKQRRSDGWLDPSTVTGDIDELDRYAELTYLDFAAGHGSFAAGVVQSIEPQARIRLYLALDTDGVGNLADVADAIVTAARAGAQIINLSLGIRTQDGQPPSVLVKAIDTVNALPDPPLLIAAAGNFGDFAKTFPAGCDTVVAVGSLTSALDRSRWSNYGSWVSCSTIGEGIVAPYVRGRTDPRFGAIKHFPVAGTEDSWAAWSGTSFAAPQITAAVARIMRENDLALTPQQAYATLVAGRPVDPECGVKILLLPGTPRQ